MLATAGLFLLAGAPFLAAGTIIVYAGAIIVTFLFVIMLAQMEGKALYDRAARSPGGATFTCFLLLWCLIYALSAICVPSRRAERPTSDSPGPRGRSLARTREFDTAFQLLEAGGVRRIVWTRAYRPTIVDQRFPRASRSRTSPGLGESLYTDHLVLGRAGRRLVVRRPGRGGRDHQPQEAWTAGPNLTAAGRFDDLQRFPVDPIRLTLS